jgi:TM2 domain-containing membrane protein YozV
MLVYLVEHFFAGIWGLLISFGIGIALICLLIAGAVFVPIDKKYFVYAAIMVGLFVAGEAVGTRFEKAHNTAQNAETGKFVGKVVKGTTTKKAKASADPWNNRSN